MEKENFQNTSELKFRDTSEIKAVNENGEDGNYGYSEKAAKKQNFAAIIVCVVIAFVIWLIISNIKATGDSNVPQDGEILPPQTEEMTPQPIVGDGAGTVTASFSSVENGLV